MMMQQQTTLNCAGRLIDLSRPRIMGILNITPDSFYDGGTLANEKDLLLRAEKMLTEGATFLDIGGMSSRPGAEVISVEEELARVIPAVQAVVHAFPEAFISVDTVRSATAKQAVANGAHLINDISAGQFDENLYQTVADLGIPYVLMHMQGQPKTMQTAPDYEDVVQDVLDFFIGEVAELRALGVKDIILDPGFGFGKTVEHNYELLRKMHLFEMLELPVLAGISRKSMICKPLKVNPQDALNGTTALHMIALQQGAKILRVHDVREAAECIVLFDTCRPL